MIDVLTHPCGWIGTQKSAIIKKRKSWKSYKYSKSVLAHAKYVKDRNECTNAVSESKSKVKSFWNYINSKLKTRSVIGTLERSDGTLASSEADKLKFSIPFSQGLTVFTLKFCLKYRILFTILYTCFLISLSKKAEFQLSGKRQSFLLFSKRQEIKPRQIQASQFDFRSV